MKAYYQYFSPRNPKSNWSRVNEEKMNRLEQEQHLQPNGLHLMALAKKTRTWTALDAAEALIFPDDLQALFDQAPIA